MISEYTNCQKKKKKRFHTLVYLPCLSLMLKFLITEESFASKDCSDWLTLVLFNSPLPLLKASVTTAVENITETRNKVLELRLMIKSHSNSKPGNLAQVCFGSQHAKKDRSGGSSCWHPAKLQLNQRKMIMPKLSELCLSGSLNMHHDLSLGSGHLESLWSSSVWQHCSLDGDLHLALGAVLCWSSASPSLLNSVSVFVQPVQLPALCVSKYL